MESAILPLFQLLILLLSAPASFAVTDPGDIAVLEAFRKGLDNPELLKWPESGDPCGPPQWPHVFCSAGRVTQIQVQNLGLQGTLPPTFNQLSKLSNLGFQRNSFRGPLPTFAGLDGLLYAYLDFNNFDSIPADFFDGLTSLQVLALDGIPTLNQSTGWTVPPALADAAQLVNFTCSGCNLVGTIPEFLGTMPSLTALHLSYNNLSGPVPASFRQSNLQSLQLNNQNGEGLSGTIDFLPSMTSLTQVWLHGNSFSGSIPENISQCTSLAELFLNNNKLSGVVPASLVDMKNLNNVKLDNNLFLGEIPDLKISNFTYGTNSFCQQSPGIPCSPEVDALLDFLGGVNYPLDLAAAWTGDDPCNGPWLGVSCRSGAVSVINLQTHNLSGTISPSLGKLQSLQDIRLGGNHLSGTIPANLTNLPSLKMLNLTGNNLSPPVPIFRSEVTLLTDQNPLLTSPNPATPPNPTPGDSRTDSPASGSPGQSSPPGRGSNPGGNPNTSKGSSTVKIAVIAGAAAVLVALIVVVVTVCIVQRRKKRKDRFVSSSILVHPRDSSDPKNMLKVTLAQNGSRTATGSGFQNQDNNAGSNTHLIQSGDILVSVQILREATHNFSPENELGRGGFGVVYKGCMPDGTEIAVKRMESSVITSKAANEFTSEIEVLSKVRHRNLVSLLGHSMEGPERLLVYEYMPQGALSKHLFKWKTLNLEPLSWKKRLNIALDVARGLEYLHNLAQQSFIHRDLKSANILLDNDFRAKISDFGLVKHASDGKNSVCTRLAGTFGYLAPEYAVTGKVTTKVDVYSYGVVLMELITGLTALDESRTEETRYLAYWFSEVKTSKEKLRKAIDTSLDVSDETFDSILIVAELAGHCAAREPSLRPDMGHAVNVLAPLVQKWKPADEDEDEYLGIDFHQPLLHMVECWQAADGSNMSSMSLDDSKGSIPARPAGFAESFTSADGR